MKYFYSSNYVALKNFSTFTNFILGLTFAFGFTPCIGPVLGALLTLTSNSETLNQGIGLLVSFSIGLSIPFITISILSGILDHILMRIRVLKLHLMILKYQLMLKEL